MLVEFVVGLVVLDENTVAYRFASLSSVTTSLEGRTIEPMKGNPVDTVPRGDEWVYELKWDGMRVLAYIAGGKVRLQSSNRRDVGASFPELATMGALNDDFEALILDGEVVAFDGTQPSFGALQNRMHVVDPADAVRRAATTPVIFVAFDLLHLNGHDTMGLALHQRRRLLEEIDDDNPVWTICDQYGDDYVDSLLDVVTEQQLEGIIAKRADSVYQSGRRSSDWVKFKPQLRQEFVVGGWMGGRGNRQGGVGSLLLGYYQDATLHFAGRAGSGLTEGTQREWLAVLVEQAECPFESVPDIPRDRTTHWCEPTQVVEIAFGEWPVGKHIRHPVVLGRRTDKDPADVVRER